MWPVIKWSHWPLASLQDTAFYREVRWENQTYLLLVFLNFLGALGSHANWNTGQWPPTDREHPILPRCLDGQVFWSKITLFRFRLPGAFVFRRIMDLGEQITEIFPYFQPKRITIISLHIKWRTMQWINSSVRRHYKRDGCGITRLRFHFFTIFKNEKVFAEKYGKRKCSKALQFEK